MGGMNSRRFVRWKVKYQRVTGYVSLATFVIVLYQLVRDLWSSPYLPWKPEDFGIFLLLALAAAGVLFGLLAQWDWMSVFPAEMGISHAKDPMFFSTAFRDATMLHRFHHDDSAIEMALRVMYFNVGREPEFTNALRLVREADVRDKSD